MESKDELKILSKECIINKDYKRALKLYNKIIELYGDDSQIYYYIALTYLELDDMDSFLYYIEISNNLTIGTEYYEKQYNLYMQAMLFNNKGILNPKETSSILIPYIANNCLKNDEQLRAIKFLDELVSRKDNERIPFKKINKLYYEIFLSLEEYSLALYYLKNLKHMKCSDEKKINMKIEELYVLIKTGKNKVYIDLEKELAKENMKPENYSKIKDKILYENIDFDDLMAYFGFDLTTQKEYLCRIIKDCYLEGQIIKGDYYLKRYLFLPEKSSEDKENIETLQKNKKLYILKSKTL